MALGPEHRAALSRDRNRLHLPRKLWLQFLPCYLQLRAARVGRMCQVWVLWDLSDHSLHQSTAQLEQQADVLVRAGPPETPQKQQFQT